VYIFIFLEADESIREVTDKEGQMGKLLGFSGAALGRDSYIAPMHLLS
jgi:hypothetical protein